MNQYDHQPQQSARTMNGSYIAKVDNAFYNSYLKTLRLYWRYAAFHLVKLIVIIIFLIACQQYSSLANNFALILGFSVIIYSFYVISYYMLQKYLLRTAVALEIAQQVSHIVQEQINSRGQIISNATIRQERKNQQLRVCIDIYDCNNGQMIYSDQQKDKLQDNLTIQIIDILQDKYYCFKGTVYLMHFSSLMIVGYVIIELIQSKPDNQAVYAFLVAFIVIQLLAKYNMVIVGLAITIAAPFVCTFLVFYVLYQCYNKMHNDASAQKAISTLKTIKYSPKLNLEDPTCPICLQSFLIGDDLIQLPCNNKHVFNKFCVQKWLKVTLKCPLCRTSINNLSESPRSGPIP